MDNESPTRCTIVYGRFFLCLRHKKKWLLLHWAGSTVEGKRTYIKGWKRITAAMAALGSDGFV